jgi:hypothetical protein
MAMKGLIGAVYQNDAAPIKDNTALIFNWTLEIDSLKDLTFGPQLNAIPHESVIKAEAYWSKTDITKCPVFIRLFIKKEGDVQNIQGNVELLDSLKKSDYINEIPIKLLGIGGLRCETR